MFSEAPAAYQITSDGNTTYELIFREAVSALRKSYQLIPELRHSAVSGAHPSIESIKILKGLTAGTLLKLVDRRIRTRRGDLTILLRGEKLTHAIEEFIDLIVDEVYLGYAAGNFAKFIRLENSLADGIYFYTESNLPQLWEKYKLNKADKQEDNNNSILMEE